MLPLPSRERARWSAEQGPAWRGCDRGGAHGPRPCERRHSLSPRGRGRGRGGAASRCVSPPISLNQTGFLRASAPLRFEAVRGKITVFQGTATGYGGEHDRRSHRSQHRGRAGHSAAPHGSHPAEVQGSQLDNVSQAVADQFKRPEVRSTVKPGMTIARGLRQPRHRQHRRMRQAGRRRAQGPRRQAFHLPGHGQPRRRHRRKASARCWKDYGITESYVGCPIQSQMEVVELGKVDGMPVYMDKLAAAADGVVLRLPRSSRTPISARPSRAASSR